MPVAGRDDRQFHVLEQVRIHVQHGDDGVAVGHAECAAGQEVILHIHDDQRIAGPGMQFWVCQRHGVHLHDPLIYLL